MPDWLIPVLSILIAMVVAVGCYIAISMKEGTFVNFMTPVFFLQFPSTYLLELGHLSIFGPSGSSYAYAYLFSCIALSNLVFALVYIYVSVDLGSKPEVQESEDDNGFGMMPFILLVLSAALYAPILVGHLDLIASPREIYELTRTGYGGYFYLSSTLTFLSYIFYLFADRRRPFEHIVFLITCFYLAFLHGSKGQILTFVFIASLYYIYVYGMRMLFFKSLRYGLFSAVLMMGLFYYYSVGVSVVELSSYIASYSDYNRNAMLVIDADRDPYYGGLAVENEFFARVPRAIYPDKPKNYGTFRLAEIFFPESFEADKGAPAFGYGLLYSDFKIFTIFVSMALSVMMALMTKAAVTSLKASKKIFWFIVLLFLSGISLIPTGAGFLLPEHVVLAAISAALTRVRIRW